MMLITREKSTYKLWLMLNFCVIFYALFLLLILVAPQYQFIGNLLVLLSIFLAFLFYGKYRFSLIRCFVFSFAAIFYLARAGVFTIGVPLIPLLGLFLIPKRHNLELFSTVYKERAKKISIFTLFAIYIILYIGVAYFGVNTTNSVSIAAMYLIIANLIFFREVFSLTVVFAVVLSLFFTPGLVSYGELPTLGLPYTHQGNRSAVFLVLFLFNKKFIQYLYSIAMSKRYFKFSIIVIALILYVSFYIGNDFLSRDKMINIYDDPRFQWFGPLLELMINDGIVSFFDHGGDVLYELGDGRRNPHNSFFYLLLEEYWIGLVKVLLFVCSAFVLPMSAWLAIAGRASFDIFFMLGPINIIPVIMMSIYFNIKLKELGRYLNK